MRVRQKIILAIGLLTLAACLVYPPWAYCRLSGSRLVAIEYIEHRWLLAKPINPDGFGIHASLLLLELGAVCALTGAAMLLAGHFPGRILSGALSSPFRACRAVSLGLKRRKPKSKFEPFIEQALLALFFIAGLILAYCAGAGLIR